MAKTPRETSRRAHSGISTRNVNAVGGPPVSVLGSPSVQQNGAASSVGWGFVTDGCSTEGPSMGNSARSSYVIEVRGFYAKGVCGFRSGFRSVVNSKTSPSIRSQPSDAGTSHKSAAGSDSGHYRGAFDARFFLKSSSSPFAGHRPPLGLVGPGACGARPMEEAAVELTDHRKRHKVVE